MDGWMDGWMGGWMNGWIDGWMNGWIDGWMGRWTGGWMDGWMDGWVNGQVDGWMGWWMDRWMDGWTNEWTDEKIDECLNTLANEMGFESYWIQRSAIVTVIYRRRFHSDVFMKLLNHKMSHRLMLNIDVTKNIVATKYRLKLLTGIHHWSTFTICLLIMQCNIIINIFIFNLEIIISDFNILHTRAG